MQVNSITGYNFGKSMMFSRAAEPAPAPQQPQQPQQPEQEPAKSIYFTGKKDNSGRSLRNATMAFLIPLTMATAVGPTLTSCEKDTEAYAWAYAEGNANAEASDSCGCGHRKDSCNNDTTKHDTIPVDTTKHDTIPVIPSDDFNRPLPLDTLAKHMYIWNIDNFNDTTANAKRNIIHYHYARPWEYNNEVDANMNIKESKQDKQLLVHDTEVKDYKGNHLYYGKEVREVPKNPITLETYSGKKIKTNALMTLESRRCDGDVKGASLRNTSLDYKLALMTVGDTVLVFRQGKDGVYKEDGKMAKGYLDDNTILLQDLIGEYATDDHLTDWKLTAITDDELKNLIKKED